MTADTNHPQLHGPTGAEGSVAPRRTVAGLHHATVRLLAPVILCAFASPLAAQTDYYNTDAGRPLRIEDATAIERRAFEIQAAPVRLERSASGAYHWGIEPEIAYGILPRTNIELGVPFAFIDHGGDRASGLSGIHLSAFHNLNVETSIPALALSASVLLPVGALAPDEPYTSVKGLMTRTFTWARFHVNGEYTIGSRLDADDADNPGAAELSSWAGGLAVDRAFPLRAMLVGAEVYVREPLHADEALEWNTGVGIRYQLDPRFNIDGGVGRRLTGPDRGWYITFGTAYAVGLPWRP